MDARTTNATWESRLRDRLLQIDACSNYPWYTSELGPAKFLLDNLLHARNKDNESWENIYAVVSNYIKKVEGYQIAQRWQEHTNAVPIKPPGKGHEHEINQIVAKYDPVRISKISVSQFDQTFNASYAKTACTFISLEFFMDMCRTMALFKRLATSEREFATNEFHRNYLKMIDRDFWNQGVIESIERYKYWFNRSADNKKLCTPQEALDVMNGKTWRDIPKGIPINITIGSGNPHEIPGVNERWINLGTQKIEDTLIELRTISIYHTVLTGRLTVAGLLFVAGNSTMCAMYLPFTDKKMWLVFDSHGTFVDGCAASLAFDVCTNAAEFLTDQINQKIKECADIAGLILRWSEGEKPIKDDALIQQFEKWLPEEVMQRLKSKRAHDTL